MNHGKAARTAAFPTTCRGCLVFAQFVRIWRVLVRVWLLVVLSSTPMMAGPFEDAVEKFTKDSFADTESAIGAISTSADPRAPAIIAALQEGRLLADQAGRRVFIKARDGRLTDAVSGEAIAGQVNASAVRLNNRLRRVVEASLGAVTLQAPEASKRLDAAHALFKSRDEGMLGALEAALGVEKDATVKAAFEQARAVIMLSKADVTDAEKIEAVGLVRARGDQEALAVLSNLPAGTSVAVARTAASAAKAIENRLAAWGAVQNAWYGLSLGSVLLLAAIGLAITFGVMGVINMAHGEMVMLGAYTTFVVQDVIRASYPALFDYSLLIAVPLAFLVAGLIGVLIERGVIRFLYGRPLETLLATFGLSLILQQAVRTIFGPTNREVGAPSWMSGAFDIGQITITYNRLWIIIFTLAVFVILLLMLRFTRLGLEMRAVTQNRAMAASMGIATSRIDALTFGLGSGIAGIAGVALSQIDNVSPNLGQGYIIDSFMVVVFGGVGNLWGTLVGALTLGIANKFLEPVAGAVLGKIAILVLIILFIQKRPRGLFALKGRAVES